MPSQPGIIPGSKAQIEIVLVDPSAGEVTLMHVTPPLADG